MEISVIVPVYKGEKTLEKLFLILESSFLNVSAWEVILVYDDGPDNSWDVIRKVYNEQQGRVKAIRLKRNFGQHIATTIGLIYAEGGYIVTIDEDLQYDPHEITKLIETAKKRNAELVYGIPDTSFHGKLRQAGSLILKSCLECSHLRISNNYSSFRIISRSLAEKLFFSDYPCLFIDAALSKLSKGIDTVEVNHQARENGKSSYTIPRLAFHAFKILIVFTNLVRYIIVFNILSILIIIFLFYLNASVFTRWGVVLSGVIAGLAIITGMLLLLRRFYSARSFRKIKEESLKMVTTVL